MAVRIVRLGSDRAEGEGLRMGTVRRPPRGVPKKDFSSRNWYDVWFPNLSPSAETMKLGKNVRTDREWLAFEKKYRAEMARRITFMYWKCWPPFPITRTSRWDATVKTKRAVIARC